jgi:hypothetical protein
MTERMKSHDIDHAVRLILEHRENADEGLTTIDLTKSIYYDWEKMPNVEFARACNRVQRRMGAIRKEVYHDLWEQMKKNGTEQRPFDKGARLKPDFLPFALPIKESKHTWKYFNAAKYERIGNVIKNHYIKSEGLEWVARLLESVYNIDTKNDT